VGREAFMGKADILGHFVALRWVKFHKVYAFLLQYRRFLKCRDNTPPGGWDILGHFHKSSKLERRGSEPRRTQRHAEVKINSFCSACLCVLRGGYLPESGTK